MALTVERKNELIDEIVNKFPGIVIIIIDELLDKLTEKQIQECIRLYSNENGFITGLEKRVAGYVRKRRTTKPKQ